MEQKKKKLSLPDTFLTLWIFLTMELALRPDTFHSLQPSTPLNLQLPLQSGYSGSGHW